MSDEQTVTDHYTKGDLLGRLRERLREDGVDPDSPTIEALAPYDQFHGRGMEATKELADQLQVAAGDHLLDVGSGIGGPARYLADRFHARVTGIDLTEHFCEAARHLASRLGLDDRTAFHHGNALAMPFEDAIFHGAYSMNVSMNIADKSALYGEIFRVLRPGGWLVLSEIAQGPNGQVAFPTPWARTAESSFLVTPEATREGLESCGFVVTKLQSTTEKTLEYGARSKALVEAGQEPLHRAVQLIHGDLATEASANTARAAREGRTIPIEVFCTKPA
ncbi:MAG: methyltransferase domain-containing protein [Pseudomonadota bacterium]